MNDLTSFPPDHMVKIKTTPKLIIMPSFLLKDTNPKTSASKVPGKNTKTKLHHIVLICLVSLLDKSKTQNLMVEDTLTTCASLRTSKRVKNSSGNFISTLKSLFSCCYFAIVSQYRSV